MPVAGSTELPTTDLDGIPLSLMGEGGESLVPEARGGKYLDNLGGVVQSDKSVGMWASGVKTFCSVCVWDLIVSCSHSSEEMMSSGHKIAQ